MVFQWRLNDSKSPQVSRTLLSILAVFHHPVVWMVSTRLPSSKSSRPLNNPLVTGPKAPFIIGKLVTLMFHSFFQFSCNVEVLISLFIFILSVLFCSQLGHKNISNFAFSPCSIIPRTHFRSILSLFRGYIQSIQNPTHGSLPSSERTKPFNSSAVSFSLSTEQVFCSLLS